MNGGPVTSPVIFEFGDSLHDSATDPNQHVVRITITFNNQTRVLTNAVVYRSSNCRWTKIVVGLGTDNIPDSSTRVFDLSNLHDNSRTITAAQMAAAPWNVTTIEGFLNAGQITAAL